MNKDSKTDWKKLEQMADNDIDTSDIAELDDSFFEQSTLIVPAKQSITIRLDEDVVTWFKGQGQGYQTRINKLLRTYMERQEQANRR